MPPKSIWRSKDAQHFTLVHRSQRDPLIHDPDASSRVLAPTQRGQRQKDKGAPISRSELEDEYKNQERPNVGEAANYGVYFDDTEYDYMQHLRPIGGNYNAQRGGKDEEDDVDVVMLPGPAGKNQAEKGKGKAKAGGDLEFKDDQLEMPQGTMASKTEMERDWARGTTQEQQGGLRLDMDPHLRQVLEALDDEAFLAGKRRQRQQEAEAAQTQAAEAASGSADPVQDEFEADGDDDFDALFSEVIAGGEFDSSEVSSSDNDWRQLPPEGDESLYLTAADKAKKKLESGGLDNPELSLAERVALFKEGLAPGADGGLSSLKINDQDDTKAPGTAVKPRKAAVASSIGGSSIFGDTSGKKTKPGSKARHAMSFYAPSADGGSTAWSMSSSAMERNAGLRNVDDGFDRMEQIYEQDDEGEEEEDDFDGDFDDEDEDGEGDGEGYIREDFETILDEFLNDKEVVAGKIRQRLGGRDATGAELLDIFRKEVGQAKLDQWLNDREETQEEIDKDIEGRIRVVGGPPKDWDVETIQTTKTNVSNHPRMISTSGSSVASSRSSLRPGTLSSNGGSSLHSQDGGSEFESIPKVKVNPRTGKPEIVGWTRQRKSRVEKSQEDQESDVASHLSSLNINIDDDDDDDGSGPPPAAFESADTDSESEDTETEETFRRETIKRDRNESKEDKKQRKEAAKISKQQRKIQKSARKQEFANERKRQVKMDSGRIKDGGAADVRVGAAKRLN
ncbi:unnamed protein product [Sympodiomycopsis kandeliae]